MKHKDIQFLKEKGYFQFPKILQFEITRRCPFNCSQCYKEIINNREMDYGYLSNMIKQAVDNEVRLITLNGGEPLLYSRIYDLLENIGEKHIQTNIFSSGYNLSDEIIQLLKKYENLNFYISLNGSTNEINSLSRNGYEISMEAIRKLSNSDLNYGINWVARHDNVHDFPNMLKLCRNYGVSFISVTSNKLSGTGEIHSQIEYDDFILLTSYINCRTDSKPLIFIESCFSMLSTNIVANKNSFSAHCYAGISNCTVNCDYTFQPCTHLKYPEKYDSIENYWHNSIVLKELRNTPSNKLVPCKNCKHNKICSLCRAMSLETYTDFQVGASKCINYV